MTSPKAQPHPLLVAELADRAEVCTLVEAALEETVAFVHLSELPTTDAEHLIELRSPDLSGPVPLFAIPAGEASGGLVPLLLRPRSPEHAPALRQFVDRLQVTLAHRPRGSGTVASGAPRPPEASGTALSQAVAPLPADEAEEEERTSLLDTELVGRLVGSGRYRIETLLGAGGMGRVYAARHVLLDQPAAVKVLRSTFRSSEEFAKRFHREALAASKLDHPNVMRVMDFGEEPDGLLYLVMELLQGKDLAHVLLEEKVLPAERALELMAQTCAGLAAAHAAGVVHRDMKPENIFLVDRIDDDGVPVETVKVCDFGLATMHQGGPGARGEPGASIDGTPHYMAPEQCQGLPADGRADVYGCGIILFELLTGAVPFDDEDPMRILGMHVSAPAPAPSSKNPAVPQRLDAIVLRALAKAPEARYASVRDLREDLLLALDLLRNAPRSRSMSGRPKQEWWEAAAPVSIQNAPASPAAVSVPAPAPKSVSPPSSTSRARTPDAQLDDAPPDLEARMTALAGQPGAVLSRIASLTELPRYRASLATLVHGVPLLSARGDRKTVHAVLAWVAREAGSDAPSLETRRGLAARAREKALTAAVLAELAQEAVEGASELQNGAALVLAAAGAAGAAALCTLRTEGTALSPRARPRFVTVLKGVPGGAEPLARALATLEPDMADPAVLEDLLRAVPETLDTGLAAAVRRFVGKGPPRVRRVAVTALPAVAGMAARQSLYEALADEDDGVRIQTLAGLRRLRIVDRPVAERIGALFASGSGGEELRAAAAAALGEADASARTAASLLLLREIEPRTRSLVDRFRGDSASSNDLVVEAVARALVAIGGDGGREAIARRASASRGELADKLRKMLATGGS
jgi:eukaryotic-like serine/threonine-protein kinase